MIETCWKKSGNNTSNTLWQVLVLAMLQIPSISVATERGKLISDDISLIHNKCYRSPTPGISTRAGVHEGLHVLEEQRLWIWRTQHDWSDQLVDSMPNQCCLATLQFCLLHDNSIQWCLAYGKAYSASMLWSAEERLNWRCRPSSHREPCHLPITSTNISTVNPTQDLLKLLWLLCRMTINEVQNLSLATELVGFQIPALLPLYWSLSRTNPVYFTKNLSTVDAS